MLKFSLEDAQVWKRIVDAVQSLVDEATLSASPDGVRIYALTEDRVAMVNTFLPTSFFEIYECPNELKFSLSFTELSRYLKIARSGDMIRIEIPDNIEYLKLVLSGASTRSILMRSLIGETQKYQETKFNTTAEIKLISSEFDQIIKSMSLGSDIFTIKADTEKFTFIAETDISETKVSYKADDSVVLEFNVEEPATSKYNLKILSSITPASKTSDMFALRLATDKPVEVEFPLGGEGWIKYDVAPMIG